MQLGLNDLDELAVLLAHVANIDDRHFEMVKVSTT